MHNRHEPTFKLQNIKCILFMDTTTQWVDKRKQLMGIIKCNDDLFSVFMECILHTKEVQIKTC